MKPRSYVLNKKDLFFRTIAIVLLASCSQNPGGNSDVSVSEQKQVTVGKGGNVAPAAPVAPAVSVICSSPADQKSVPSILSSLQAHFTFVNGQPPFFWWANLAGSLISPVQTAKAPVSTEILGQVVSLSGANIANGLDLQIWFNGPSSVIPYPSRTQGSIQLRAVSVYGASNVVDLTAGISPPFEIDPVQLNIPIKEQSFSQLPAFAVIKVDASYKSCNANLLEVTVEFVK